MSKLSRPIRKPADRAGAILLAGIGLAVLSSWLALDPRCADAFQAPKVLLAEAGIAVAAAAALTARLSSASPLRAPAGGGRAAAVLFAIGMAGALASALLCRDRANALDTIRSASLFLLALGVGASAAFATRAGVVTALFAAGAAVNAILSILAARNLYSPLIVLGSVKRTAFGALLGNAGQLGICLALAAVALLPAAAFDGTARSAKLRWTARAGLAVVVAGIVATQTLSGLAALAAGAAVYLILRMGRRAALPLAGALVLVASATAASRQLRFRVIVAASHFHSGDWNAALSARAAPWLAGAEMVRAHPVFGIGPGNFGREFIPARLSAEARHRQRLVVPGMANNSFSEAHSDYLDLAAAAGLPAAACIVASFLIVLVHAFARGREDPRLAFVASGLTAGAVAAATWFPFQIVASGVWLLLLAGAGFRSLSGAR